MESRLPKPSALKKPRDILPMDRINTTTFGNKSAQFPGNHATSSFTFQPLTRNLANMHNFSNAKDRRAASPETRTSNKNAPSKLRRSVSACDMRDVGHMKRAEPILAPIPTKSSRITPSAVTTTNINKCLRIVSNSTIGVPNNTIQRPAGLNRKPVSTRTDSSTKVTATNKPKITIKNTTTSAVVKSNSKRIAPYDFKARFNDLLEKHRALKEKLEDKTEQLISLENLPEQLEDIQSELITTQNSLKNTQTIKECLEGQVESQRKKIEFLETSLNTTKNELENLLRTYNELKLQHDQTQMEISELRERSTELTEKNVALLEENTAVKQQLFRSNSERKELHNTVMDLRGNIRVFCRVRPPLKGEEGKPLCGWNFIDEATVEIVNFGKNKQNGHTFSFDQVFHQVSCQEPIFEMVSPLIQSALDGYNICIFAYGQTGSGKTYTMDGIPSNPGVIPRTVDLLFDSIKNYQYFGWEYEVKVTFLEIYNEVLYDLLSNEQKEMEIRMARSNKNDIYVSNITQETVNDAARLRHLMNIAKMNRATAATIGNDRSSRSHAVTKIEVIGTHCERQEISIGSINLVDLAGSESPKTSIRMNETKNINRSLSELTNVILALLQKQDHIPYRNSKLTHLLMPSLGGNSKTLMFINVAPFQDCFVESLKSLRFAASVNKCKIAKAKRNRILNTSSMGNYSSSSN